MKNEALRTSYLPCINIMDRNTSIEGAIWLLNNTKNKSILHKSFITIQANADYILKRQKYRNQLYHAVKKLVANHGEELELTYEPIKELPKPRLQGTTCLYLTSFYCAFLVLSAFLHYRTATT